MNIDWHKIEAAALQLFNAESPPKPGRPKFTHAHRRCWCGTPITSYATRCMLHARQHNRMAKVAGKLFVMLFCVSLISFAQTLNVGEMNVGKVSVSKPTLTPSKRCNVRLAWNGSPSDNVAGYIIGYGLKGMEHEVDVGNKLTATVSNLISGQTYRFSCKAYTAGDVQSVWCEEIKHRP